MQAIDVVKELVKMGLTGVKLEWHDYKELFYYDLNTEAKSHLYLFEDFHVEGRGDYSHQLDSEMSIEDILRDLFFEFKSCIQGRDFYNSQWMEIGVKLGLVEKKVTITYESGKI